MTVTNDERREVAARLRDFENLQPTFKDSVLCGFLEALDVGYLDWEGVCNRLADLIEPERTCRNAAVTPLAFRCGKCGWFDKNRCDFNFCPNCGARVID